MKLQNELLIEIAATIVLEFGSDGQCVIGIPLPTTHRHDTDNRLAVWTL